MDSAGKISGTEAPDDVRLMERVKAGDRDAFTALIRRHQGPLVNFFRRMGADTHEAEDMTQATFLRLYGYRLKYAPTAKFTTFLYTLARNAWTDNVRKLKRWRNADFTDGRWEVAGPEEVRRIENRLVVQEALSRLSERLRIVVVMSVYQGLRYEEISEALEIPVGTVKSRMFIALRRLKEVLDERSR